MIEELVIPKNPLELDLLGGSMNHDWGIDNTIGGWTVLEDRAHKLRMGLEDRFKVRRQLYRCGYLLAEIGQEERPNVDKGTVFLSVNGVEKPHPIVILRTIFNPRGAMGMDDVVKVLRGFIEGREKNEMADMVGITLGTMGRRLKVLRESEFRKIRVTI